MMFSPSRKSTARDVAADATTTTKAISNSLMLTDGLVLCGATVPAGVPEAQVAAEHD
jgi:hypothetical protein